MHLRFTGPRFVVVASSFALLATLLTPTLHAQNSAAGKTLLDAANRDRVAAGLKPLKSDPALASAAHQHALRMAKANTLSHQFPGEPPLQDRARHAGARFSMIAENVALGPSIPGLHTQWMNSPPHRANLLDPGLNSVGISVVQSGENYFAVEDFSNAVPALSMREQEEQLLAELAKLGLKNVSATADARKACKTETGLAVQKAATVVRYETANVSDVPREVAQKIKSGNYHSANIGACEPDKFSDFARYRLAIVLF